MNTAAATTEIDLTALLLAERLQRIIYNSGLDLGGLLAADNKQLSKLLTAVYVGAVQDTQDFPEVSGLIAMVTADSCFCLEPVVFDTGLYKADTGLYRQTDPIEL